MARFQAALSQVNKNLAKSQVLADFKDTQKTQSLISRKLSESPVTQSPTSQAKPLVQTPTPSVSAPRQQAAPRSTPREAAPAGFAYDNEGFLMAYAPKTEQARDVEVAPAQSPATTTAQITSTLVAPKPSMQRKADTTPSAGFVSKAGYDVVDTTPIEEDTFTPPVYLGPGLEKQESFQSSLSRLRQSPAYKKAAKQSRENLEKEVAIERAVVAKERQLEGFSELFPKATEGAPDYNPLLQDEAGKEIEREGGFVQMILSRISRGSKEERKRQANRRVPRRERTSGLYPMISVNPQVKFSEVGLSLETLVGLVNTENHKLQHILLDMLPNVNLEDPAAVAAAVTQLVNEGLYVAINKSPAKEKELRRLRMVDGPGVYMNPTALAHLRGDLDGDHLPMWFLHPIRDAEEIATTPGPGEVIIDALGQINWDTDLFNVGVWEADIELLSSLVQQITGLTPQSNRAVVRMMRMIGSITTAAPAERAALIEQNPYQELVEYLARAYAGDRTRALDVMVSLITQAARKLSVYNKVLNASPRDTANSFWDKVENIFADRLITTMNRYDQGALSPSGVAMFELMNAPQAPGAKKDSVFRLAQLLMKQHLGIIEPSDFMEQSLELLKTSDALYSMAAARTRDDELRQTTAQQTKRARILTEVGSIQDLAHPEELMDWLIRAANAWNAETGLQVLASTEFDPGKNKHVARIKSYFIQNYDENASPTNDDAALTVSTEERAEEKAQEIPEEIEPVEAVEELPHYLPADLVVTHIDMTSAIRLILFLEPDLKSKYVFGSKTPTGWEEKSITDFVKNNRLPLRENVWSFNPETELFEATPLLSITDTTEGGSLLAGMSGYRDIQDRHVVNQLSTISNLLTSEIDPEQTDWDNPVWWQRLGFLQDSTTSVATDIMRNFQTDKNTYLMAKRLVEGVRLINPDLMEYLGINTIESAYSENGQLLFGANSSAAFMSSLISFNVQYHLDTILRVRHELYNAELDSTRLKELKEDFYRESGRLKNTNGLWENIALRIGDPFSNLDDHDLDESLRLLLDPRASLDEKIETWIDIAYTEIRPGYTGNNFIAEVMVPPSGNDMFGYDYSFDQSRTNLERAYYAIYGAIRNPLELLTEEATNVHQWLTTPDAKAAARTGNKSDGGRRIRRIANELKYHPEDLYHFDDTQLLAAVLAVATPGAESAKKADASHFLQLLHHIGSEVNNYGLQPSVLEAGFDGNTISVDKLAQKPLLLVSLLLNENIDFTVYNGPKSFKIEAVEDFLELAIEYPQLTDIFKEFSFSPADSNNTFITAYNTSKGYYRSLKQFLDPDQNTNRMRNRVKKALANRPEFLALLASSVDQRNKYPEDVSSEILAKIPQVVNTVIQSALSPKIPTVNFLYFGDTEADPDDFFGTAAKRANQVAEVTRGFDLLVKDVRELMDKDRKNNVVGVNYFPPEQQPKRLDLSHSLALWDFAFNEAMTANINLAVGNDGASVKAIIEPITHVRDHSLDDCGNDLPPIEVSIDELVENPSKYHLYWTTDHSTFVDTTNLDDLRAISLDGKVELRNPAGCKHTLGECASCSAADPRSSQSTLKSVIRVGSAVQQIAQEEFAILSSKYGDDMSSRLAKQSVELEGENVLNLSKIQDSLNRGAMTEEQAIQELGDKYLHHLTHLFPKRDGTADGMKAVSRIHAYNIARTLIYRNENETENIYRIFSLSQFSQIVDMALAEASMLTGKTPPQAEVESILHEYIQSNWDETGLDLSDVANRIALRSTRPRNAENYDVLTIHHADKLQKIQEKGLKAKLYIAMQAEEGVDVQSLIPKSYRQELREHGYRVTNTLEEADFALVNATTQTTEVEYLMRAGLPVYNIDDTQDLQSMRRSYTVDIVRTQPLRLPSAQDPTYRIQAVGMNRISPEQQADVTRALMRAGQKNVELYDLDAVSITDGTADFILVDQYSEDNAPLINAAIERGINVIDLSEPDAIEQIEQAVSVYWDYDEGRVDDFFTMQAGSTFEQHNPTDFIVESNMREGAEFGTIIGDAGIRLYGQRQAARRVRRTGRYTAQLAGLFDGNITNHSVAQELNLYDKPTDPSEFDTLEMLFDNPKMLLPNSMTREELGIFKGYFESGMLNDQGFLIDTPVMANDVIGFVFYSTEGYDATVKGRTIRTPGRTIAAPVRFYDRKNTSESGAPRMAKVSQVSLSEAAPELLIDWEYDFPLGEVPTKGYGYPHSSLRFSTRRGISEDAPSLASGLEIDGAVDPGQLSKKLGAVAPRWYMATVNAVMQRSSKIGFNITQVSDQVFVENPEFRQKAENFSTNLDDWSIALKDGDLTFFPDDAKLNRFCNQLANRAVQHGMDPTGLFMSSLKNVNYGYIFHEGQAFQTQFNELCRRLVPNIMPALGEELSDDHIFDTDYKALMHPYQERVRILATHLQLTTQNPAAEGLGAYLKPESMMAVANTSAAGAEQADYKREKARVEATRYRAGTREADIQRANMTEYLSNDVYLIPSDEQEAD